MKNLIREYRRKRRRVVRVAAFGLAGWMVAEATRAPRAPARVNTNVAAPVQEAQAVTAAATADRPRAAGVRRPLGAFGFAVLFFAGASFTAVAGDQVAGYLGDGTVLVAEESAEAETETAEDDATEPLPVVVEEEEETTSAEPAGGDDALVVEPAPVAAAEPEPTTPPAAQEETSAAHPERTAAASSEARSEQRRATASAPRVAASAPLSPASPSHPHSPPSSGDEAAGHAHAHAHAGFSTVWLDRELADPTPRSLRLTPAFARRLRVTAKAEGVHWSLVLATLRADGNRRRVPARPPTLAKTARDLAAHGARRDPWAAVLALGGRTAYADRAVALATYYRAVGLRALVHGFRAEEGRLAQRLLADERVHLYPGGRDDLAAGRVDVRVVALIAYLRQSFGQVTVSSLISGHRYYSRPGVVSAHVYGAAVDIAALGGVSVLGNQGRGSLTERAVREILLLPAEMLPRQVISLFGLGGPSFPLADHHDHIHVGY